MTKKMNSMYSKPQMEKYRREGFLKGKEVAGWKDMQVYIAYPRTLRDKVISMET